MPNATYTLDQVEERKDLWRRIKDRRVRHQEEYVALKRKHQDEYDELQREKELMFARHEKERLNAKSIDDLKKEKKRKAWEIECQVWDLKKQEMKKEMRYLRGKLQDLRRERNAAVAKNNRSIRDVAVRNVKKRLNGRPDVSWWNIERDAVVSVYEESRRRRDAGEDVHVDHIIPLNGNTVSGLHVASNLQIISSMENSLKGNAFNETMLEQIDEGRSEAQIPLLFIPAGEGEASGSGSSA